MQNEPNCYKENPIFKPKTHFCKTNPILKTNPIMKNEPILQFCYQITNKPPKKC